MEWQHTNGTQVVVAVRHATGYEVVLLCEMRKQ